MRLRFYVLAAQREGQRLFAAALRPWNVSPTQAEALAVLAEHAPMSLGDLGARLIAEIGSPSRLVSGLVAAGLVTRERDEQDRRWLLLELTDHGRQIAAAVAAAEQSLYEQIGAAIADQDTDATLELLGAFVSGRPTGQALARRKLTPDSH